MAPLHATTMALSSTSTRTESCGAASLSAPFSLPIRKRETVVLVSYQAASKPLRIESRLAALIVCNLCRVALAREVAERHHGCAARLTTRCRLFFGKAPFNLMQPATQRPVLNTLSSTRARRRAICSSSMRLACTVRYLGATQAQSVGLFSTGTRQGISASPTPQRSSRNRIGLPRSSRLLNKLFSSRPASLLRA